MKPDPELFPFTPTVADATAAIRLLDGLKLSAREGLLWALRTVPRILDVAPEDLSWEALDPDRLDHSPDATGLSARSLVQLRCNLRRAARELAHLDAVGYATARRLAGVEMPTLEHAVLAVGLQSWDQATRARMVTALEKLARARSRNLADMPARTAEVEAELAAVTSSDFKVTHGTWKSMKSRIRRAAGLVNGRTIVGRDDLEADWDGLWSELESAYPDEGWRLAELWPIASFATRRGIPLNGVDDDTVAAMIEAWREKGDADPIDRAQRCTRAWNFHVGSNRVPAFPRRPLVVPTKVPVYDGLAFEDMPAAFQEAWKAYEAEVSAPLDDLVAAIVDDGAVRRGRFDDLLDPDFAVATSLAKCLKPGTLRNHRTHMLRAATAAVEAGLMPLADIISPVCLLTPPVLAATLDAVASDRQRRLDDGEAAYKNKNSYDASICDTYASMSSTFGIPERTVETFRCFRDRVDPRIVKVKIDKNTGKIKRTWNKSWMGPSHRRMLKQFSDPAKLLAWFDLPDRLVERAEARRLSGRPLKRQDIVDVEIAICARILRAIPVRRANLGGIRVYGPEPTLRMPAREGLPAYVYWAPDEVKNLAEIEAELDTETVELLRLFLLEYRPLALKKRKSHPDNPHLFPGMGLRHKGLEKLYGQFAARCQKVGEFRLDLQCCRHLAAKIILDVDPNLIDLMTEVLGHNDPRTTRRYYIQIRRLTRIRRYQKMLDQRIRDLKSRKPIWNGRPADAQESD